MSKVFNLPDGSQIEWVDRETLRYSKAGRSALVWVDFGPGFFSEHRVLKASSIRKWDADARSRSGTTEISPDDRAQIIRAVSDYYQADGVKLTIEEV